MKIVKKLSTEKIICPKCGVNLFRLLVYKKPGKKYIGFECLSCTTKYWSDILHKEAKK